MLSSAQLQSIATQMRAAHDEVRQIEPFTSRIGGFDLDSAYAVAESMHRARVSAGAVPIGRKIGFTNFDMWARYGVREPIWAYVYEHTVTRLSGSDARCGLGRFAEPMIEPEIVFHFRTTPPLDADPAALLASVDWVAQAFEIVQSHFPGWNFRAADTVADWGLHGTLLLGEPVPVERIAPEPIEALRDFSLALACGDQVQEVGRGSNVLGSPLAALAHLNAVLARQPGATPLQAGEIVTTGTITTAHTVRPGESWRTTIDGIALPDVAVRFDP